MRRTEPGATRGGGRAPASGADGPPAGPAAEGQARGGRWPGGSIGAAAAGLLRRSGGPLTLDEIADGLPAVREGAGSWRSRLRGSLARTQEVCLVGASTYDLVERRLAGACLRHVLTAAEVRHGLLLAEPDLSGLLAWWKDFPDADERPVIADAGGQPLPTRIAWLTGPQPHGRPGWTDHRGYRMVDGVGGWLSTAGARAGDEVCFWAQPPDARRFRLSLEGPAGNAVAGADAAFAEAALSVLAASRAVVTAAELLRRVAGRLDLRAAPGVHLPVFSLGRDPRFAFDGTFYAPFALAQEMSRRRLSSPYPRPEDYPSGWGREDPLPDLHAVAGTPWRYGFWYTRDGAIRVEPPPGGGGLPAATIAAVRESRAMVWDILQDRARLLNPPVAARRTARARYGNVIRGPWPG